MYNTNVTEEPMGPYHPTCKCGEPVRVIVERKNWVEYDGICNDCYLGYEEGE